MKPTLKIGVITALISSVVLFGLFPLLIWLNTKNNWGMQVSSIRGIAGLISIPIQGIGIYIAMQNVKNLTGSLTYGQAIKTGVTVAITIAVIVALFSVIYIQFINPGFAEFIIKDAQKAMIAAGESQQQISQNSVKVSKEYSISVQVIQALVGQFVTGTIMSLLIGLFVKTKKVA